MKKYRLAYDNLFSPNDPVKGIVYKNEQIFDLMLFLVYKVFDESDNEVFFENERVTNHMLEYVQGKRCYLNDFYSCKIDENLIVEITPNSKLMEESQLRVEYSIGGCLKFLSENNPIIIDYQEFKDILTNNFEAYNTTNNRPTQSTSYSAVEIN